MSNLRSLHASSQALVTETISVPSSQLAVSEQSRLEEALHSATRITIREYLQNNIGVANKRIILHEPARQLDADSISEEELGNLVETVNEPFRTIFSTYLKGIKRIRADEQHCMNTVSLYHRELADFIRLTGEQYHPEAELDRHVDMHGAQLIQCDKELNIWFNYRVAENALMAHSNNCMVEENNRKLLDDGRRIERDLQHRRRFKKGERWLQDCLRRLKEYNQWIQEHNLWVQTYENFVEDHDRKMCEYKELFTNQARFRRQIGNHQVKRYFEEIERLNDEAADLSDGDVVGIARGMEVEYEVVGARRAAGDRRKRSAGLSDAQSDIRGEGEQIKSER